MVTPNNDIVNFRNYQNVEESIKQNYFLCRKNQTLEYVKSMHKKYLTFDRTLSFDDIFNHLEKFIDVSDPDITLPNFYHGIQTAEGIRKDGHPDWLQLVGLIHDIGKIMFLKGCDEDGTSIENQWGIVGDTFVVGCRIPDSVVYPEFNNENPDMNNPKYNTKLGIYKEKCGLENVFCSWGHDEFLYQILKFNKNILPKEALYIIRYHSLYPYHKENEYKYFMNEKDKKMLHWLKLFNQYDLYTKNNSKKISSDTMIYYKNLIRKYFFGSKLAF